MLANMVATHVFLPKIAVLGAVLTAVTTAWVAPKVMADEVEPTCPAVVVIAARGSSEERTVVDEHYPQHWKFAEDGRRGWEGDTLRAMYQHIEDYAHRVYGVDAFANVQFLPLNEEYPAVPVMGSGGGYGSIPFDRMRRSSQEGTGSAMRTIDAYEVSSGCHPKYLLNGYSQGALALQAIEVELEQRNQLAGVIYLGSPIKLHQEPRNKIIGKDIHEGIMVADPQLPVAAGHIAAAHRTEYCIQTDMICNLAEENGENFIMEYGGDHKEYFTGPASTMEQRDEVAEVFLEYVQVEDEG